jgi:hypothetical protein
LEFKKDWKYFTLETKQIELMSSRFKKELTQKNTNDTSQRPKEDKKIQENDTTVEEKVLSDNEFLYSSIDPQRITFSKKIDFERVRKALIPFPQRSNKQMPYICYNCG